MMIVNADNSEVTYKDDMPRPATCSIVKFKGNDDFSKYTGVGLMAIFQLWYIKDGNLQHLRTYGLENPKIVSSIYQGSDLNRIVHLTSDKEAYVFYESKHKKAGQGEQ